MDLKRIANLTLMNSAWKIIVVVYSVGFIITFCWAYRTYRAGQFSTSDGIQFFIFWAMVGVAMFSLYELVYRTRDNELKKINDQLLYIYQPIEDATIDFQKTLPSTCRIDNINELETTVRHLLSKTVLKIDSETWEFMKQLFGSPNENTLSNFLGAVRIKIKELETKRKKYE